MQRALAAAILLFAATAADAQSKAASIFGYSQAKYQEWSDALDKRDLRPTFISVAGIGGKLAFAEIAIENMPRRPWGTRYNITAEEFQRELGERREKGFRPICISGYQRGDAINYAVVYVKDGVEPWEARWAQSGKDAGDTENKMTKDGMRPIQIVGYPGSDGPLFASIYIKSDGRHWVSRTNITAAQYESYLDEYSKKNGRPIGVCAYPTKDGTRFGIVIEENKEKIAWQERHHLTPKDYQRTLDEMTGKGYRPMNVYAYPWEGETRYLAVFVKDEK